MAFDGTAVYAIVQELKDSIIGARIDKIYQPEKDEINLIIRGYEGTKRLLIACSSNNTRLHFTEVKKENPDHPPMFCMLLRKHLSGGRIIDIKQNNFDRIVEIHIESTNELGDLCIRKLIIEIMGKHSNIILTDEDNKIHDSIKHVTPDISSVRIILPGVIYTAPPSQDKLNPLHPIEDSTLEKELKSKNESLFKALFHTFTGFSPIISQEILSRTSIDSSINTSELTVDQVKIINLAKQDIIEQLVSNSFSYKVFFDNNKMIDFSPINLNSYSLYKYKSFDTFSEVLEYYFKEKDNDNRIKQKSYDLRKFVQTSLDRCYKKKEIQEKQLRDTKNRDKYQLYGELITANIYAINKGITSFDAINYYDENSGLVSIPLDSNLTPSENAQRYFRKYNKAKRTEEATTTQLVQTNEEIGYFEGVLTSLDLADNEHDLEDIRQELYNEGYIKRLKKKGKNKNSQSSPITFVTSEGIEGRIGKNNNQNDLVTFKIAGPKDLWFHTKDIPGSHVILFVTNKEYTDQSILEAARLAAYYSKAQNSSTVPVDFTERRHVKKPNGAKPGFVIYFHQQTLYVTPDEEQIKVLIKN